MICDCCGSTKHDELVPMDDRQFCRPCYVRLMEKSVVGDFISKEMPEIYHEILADFYSEKSEE